MEVVRAVMTSANVTTEGRTAGFMKGAHISRGQGAHQVTATALYILFQKSYAEYELHTPDDEGWHMRNGQSNGVRASPV